MPKRTADYRSTLLEDLKDPTEAQHYLSAALNDSEDMFLLALRDVAEAHQMAKVAGKVGVSRESLYRMLTASGNPTYRNFFGILRALDVAFEGVRAKSAGPQLRPPDAPTYSRRRRKTSEGRTISSPDKATGPSVGKRPSMDINAESPSSRAESVGVKSSGLNNDKINMAQVGQRQIAAQAA
jgi:probable addiction module antidote protein